MSPAGRTAWTARATVRKTLRDASTVTIREKTRDRRLIET